MKDNYINLVFVVDQSGSMLESESDVVGGFKTIINKQKAIKDGKCTISLFTFADEVTEVYLGKDINEIDSIEYYPCGCTAMNDGIATAIDKVGIWLNSMEESEKPSKNLVVIMTDGFENNSKEFSIDDVKKRIKHQREKYNWEFMFVGTDITSDEYSQSVGIKINSFTSRLNSYKNYDVLNDAVAAYRCCAQPQAEETFTSTLYCATAELTSEYENEIGKKICSEQF